MFNNAGSSYSDYYFCYVSAMQYIFVRNYNTRETVKKIDLMLPNKAGNELYFPTQLCILDYNKVAANAGRSEMSKHVGIGALIAVGTKEGKVLVYRVDTNESELLLKTKSGLFYGAVTALSI